jgi:hypothetical protein
MTVGFKTDVRFSRWVAFKRFTLSKAFWPSSGRPSRISVLPSQL